MSPETLGARLQALDSALAEEGRTRDDITLIVGPSRHPINEQTVAQYRNLGVDQLVAPVFGASVEKLAMRIDALLEQAA